MKLVDGCVRCCLIEAAPVQHQAHEGVERVVDRRIAIGLLRLFEFEQTRLASTSQFERRRQRRLSLVLFAKRDVGAEKGGTCVC